MCNKLSKAIHILKQLNQPDRVVNRDRVNFTKFMDILGNPQNSFRSIHITGTNGKGSVSLKIKQVLQNAGYTVGVYTSPHIFSFR
jgi:dihydrofolate synthase/folylpolyglutamate synthase